MKYSIAFKFIALMLCALCVVSAVACGVGLVFMEAYDLHDQPLEAYREEQLEGIANELAWRYTQRYAAEELSNCSMDIIDELYGAVYVGGLLADHYAVEVYEGGRVVNTIGDPSQFHYFTPRVYDMQTTYPIATSQFYVDDSGNIQETSEPTGAAADATSAEQKVASDDPLTRVAGQTPIYSSEHYDQGWDEDGNWYSVTHTLDYYQGPEYTAYVYLDESAVLGLEYTLISALYTYQEYFIPVLLISLLLFAVTLVYLCTVAGRNRSGQIHLAAINRIPIDLYALIVCGGIVLLAVPVTFVIEAYYGYNELSGNIQLCVLICGLCGFGIALLAIGLIYAFAAQVKASDRYWWRHSICGGCLGLIGKALRWIGRGLSLFGKGCRAVFVMLPVIWQWLLTAFLMVLVTLILLFLAADYSSFQPFWILLFLAAVVADVAIVCYGGYCFGTLLKGTKTMSQGHLEHKIDTKYLFGSFKDFAVQLNSLAGAARIAAERQMKSERMKTELITNVSHDIKTPLTSIINYVDLMKKPHSDADGALYLEVLDRQSQRLKKLIDDLMEMSKASTGNLTVELGKVDAVEAVNQALGEFADKLDQVNLTPVFRHPEFPVTMIADGRHVWRILSNLLNNAVKYALPDTRLYIDLMVLQGNAVIAIKNISRDQLNVNADELMERFVRGDTSRNTEGSGLGLNIAKSLVELQHGQMHLMVDGDLFKVTLIFPCA